MGRLQLRILVISGISEEVCELRVGERFHLLVGFNNLLLQPFYLLKVAHAIVFVGHWIFSSSLVRMSATQSLEGKYFLTIRWGVSLHRNYLVSENISTSSHRLGFVSFLLLEPIVNLNFLRLCFLGSLLVLSDFPLLYHNLVFELLESYLKFIFSCVSVSETSISVGRGLNWLSTDVRISSTSLGFRLRGLFVVLYYF